MTTQAANTILDQICVAFGQGAGTIEVRRAAVAALRRHYAPALSEEVIAAWGEIGTQALERVRAAGRLAAQEVIARAAPVVEAEDALRAARVVAQTSETPVCPRADAGEIQAPPDAPGADPFDSLLGQVFVHFGQGTGPMRISRQGVAALRLRYGNRRDVLASWDAIAPQVLERIRAMGRMAARLATGKGATSIGGDEVRAAMVAVEDVSQTPVCRPSGGGSGAAAEEREPAHALAGAR